MGVLEDLGLSSEAGKGGAMEGAKAQELRERGNEHGRERQQEPERRVLEGRYRRWNRSGKSGSADKSAGNAAFDWRMTVVCWVVAC